MKQTILFLGANPESSDPASGLALNEEVRAIEQRLLAARHRDAFEFKTKWAVRPGDLPEALLQEQPVVVHFSGHGTGAAGLVLHGEGRGATKLVNADALRYLFATLRDNIRVVVLNACFSERQARDLIGVIDFVVGMVDAIDDEAARVFAASFYRGLGFGRSVQTAFDLGVAELKLEGFEADSELPVLLVREGVDARTVALVQGDLSRP